MTTAKAGLCFVFVAANTSHESYCLPQSNGHSIQYAASDTALVLIETRHVHDMQVLSIVTVAVAFVAMAGSIFGMNLYFNVQTTPPVSVCLPEVCHETCPSSLACTHRRLLCSHACKEG